MTAFFIFLLSICASFIQRTIGFGFGIFIMTMLPFLMPSYGESTALSGLLALTTSLVIVARKWRWVTWKRLWPILSAFTAFAAFSIALLGCMKEHTLKIILGVALILTSMYFIFVSHRVKLKATPAVQIGAGSISGLMGGFFGMQGPPAVLYFLAAEPDKNSYIAMTQTYLLLGNGLMTLMRAGGGYVTEAVEIAYLYGLGGVTVGTFLGACVYKHITAHTMRYLVYTYIGLSGVIVLITTMLKGA